MKVVLDTNALIAAFATQGLSHAIFELCLDQHQIILSQQILKEFSEALEKKLKVPKRTAKTTTDYLKEHAVIHRVRGPYKRIVRDASDDHVLALAQQAAVDYIITGDADLLVLTTCESIPIVRPRQFWEIMKSGENEPK